MTPPLFNNPAPPVPSSVITPKLDDLAAREALRRKQAEEAAAIDRQLTKKPAGKKKPQKKQQLESQARIRPHRDRNDLAASRAQLPLSYIAQRYVEAAAISIASSLSGITVDVPPSSAWPSGQRDRRVPAFSPAEVAAMAWERAEALARVVFPPDLSHMKPRQKQGGDDHDET